LRAVVSICAPICRSGSTMRRIGRRDSDSSPIRVVGKFWAASRPVISRIEVPELPRSSACAGSRRPCRPTPWTRRWVSASWSMRTPMARNAFMVLRQSSPVRKPRTSDWPSAREASITARCEIDLSPGTRTVPENEPPGWTVKVTSDIEGILLETGNCLRFSGAAA